MKLRYYITQSVLTCLMVSLLPLACLAQPRVDSTRVRLDDSNSCRYEMHELTTKAKAWKSWCETLSDMSEFKKTSFKVNPEFIMIADDILADFYDNLHFSPHGVWMMKWAWDINDNTIIMVLPNCEKQTVTIYDIDEKAPEMLTVDLTPMSLMQYYLLWHMKSQMQCKWHGCYSRRIFMFDNKEWTDFAQHKFDLDYDDIKKKKVRAKAPEVRIGNTEETKGMCEVSCCIFNDWSGLVRETLCFKVDEQSHQVSDIAHDYQVIYEYDCGDIF